MLRSVRCPPALRTFVVLSVVALLMNGCRRREIPLPHVPSGSTKASTDIPASVAKTATNAVANELPAHVTWVQRHFSASNVRIVIRDVHMGRDFENYLRDGQAMLVQNAGFFDEQGRPLGLAMSDGKILSRPSPNHGGVFAFDQKAAMFASEDYVLPQKPSGFAVQCLPRLVVLGEVNGAIKNDGKRAERSGICSNAEGDPIFFVARTRDGTDGLTLREFAELARERGCHNALNLDGGPSTGIAFRGDDAHPEGMRETIHAPRGLVRHVLAVVRR
jgi:uncharacterized protein YigE (DUF2233 family)